MARYRKNKSGGLPEAVFGLLMFIVAFAVLSPTLREQLVSTVRMIFTVVFFSSLAGLIYFLYRQFKNSEEPVLKHTQHIFSRPIDKPRTTFKTYKAAELPKNSATPPKNSDECALQPSYSRPVDKRRIPHATPDLANTTAVQPSFQVNIGNSVSESIFRESELPTIEPIEWNESVLHMIEWKRFEVVSEEYFRMTGFDPRVTNIGADGGVDIRIYKAGSEAPQTPEAIVQCKAWHSYKVGVKPVRELLGIMAAEQVPTGIFMTSGDFTSEAQEFAERVKLVLISGSRFIQKIKELPEENQRKLLDIALEGDYMTPTCPQCDVKMKIRVGKKGKNPGAQFWGCIRYPRCRQTLVYKEQE
jgi:hypothetical protein